MGKARSAAPRWPHRASAIAHVRQMTLAAVLADALYVLALRTHVRRAIGMH